MMNTVLYFFSFETRHTTTENDDLESNRLATAPRPGTTLRANTSLQNPQQQLVSNRPKTLSGRPLTGMVSNIQTPKVKKKEANERFRKKISNPN